MINITKQVNHNKDHVVYFALSGPLAGKFELFGSTSNLKFTKTKFFPHISMESLKLYATSIIDLLYHDKNKTHVISLTKFCDIFSLVLYSITTKTE